MSQHNNEQLEDLKAINHPRYSSLYQINTRFLLEDTAKKSGFPVTLEDVPDDKIIRLKELGFDWVYMLGVWQTGPCGLEVCRSMPVLRKELQRTMPDLEESDICGSCFAIQSYTANSEFGGNAGLKKFRTRLNKHGLKLMLDFVPNHTALDHPWSQEKPELYVHATESDLENEPQNYVRIKSLGKSIILAHGRDPNYPGWSDTLQLNYGNPSLKKEMIAELFNIAQLCDGVRCDMAMLILPEVFQQTWGISSKPFWPDAILEIKQHYPDFVFMAEVYWGLEGELLKQGFDYTYDKKLYDLLCKRCPGQIRDYLSVDAREQQKAVRFMENHDELRAAVAFPIRVHKAAAILTYLSPCLRFFYQGQFEGSRRKIPVQLRRRPTEPVDFDLQDFYCKLLACLRLPVVRKGFCQFLKPVPAWDGSCTWEGFIPFTWYGVDSQRLLVVVNYADNPGQCYVRIPFEDLRRQNFRLTDLMNGIRYDRSGDELISTGLYLDLPEWGYHVFKLGLNDSDWDG